VSAANHSEPTEEEIAAAVVAILSARPSTDAPARPLREPLSPWVASGWVPEEQILR
jgi:hypothetical protein